MAKSARNAARVLTVPRDESRSGARPGSPSSAWRAAGWFGAALAVIGYGQVLLNFYPAAGFGSPEWEFGAMAQVLAGLPLGSMGLAALLAAALANGARRGQIALAVVLAVLGLAVLGALAVFLTVAPLALKGAPAIASDTIRQTIAKTSLMGVGFALLYLLAAAGTLRHLMRTAGRPSNA